MTTRRGRRRRSPGLAVQEVAWNGRGDGLIVIRQRVQDRPQAGGKTLLELAGYRFQALVTNLPASVSALAVWRRYNGRADLENRIKELGGQFGIKRLCVDELLGHRGAAPSGHRGLQPVRAAAAAAGAVGEMRVEHAALAIVWRAAVWSRAGGKPTLKLAVRGAANRNWWREMLDKLTALPNCHAVASLQA